MPVTINVTDEQLVEAGAIFLTEHERVMLVGGQCAQRLHECYKSARREDNYTWSNSEGAGAAFLGLYRKVDPERAEVFVQRYGNPYSWRRNMHHRSPDGEWVDGVLIGYEPWPRTKTQLANDEWERLAEQYPCQCRGYEPEDPCMHGDTSRGCPLHDPSAREEYDAEQAYDDDSYDEYPNESDPRYEG